MKWSTNQGQIFKWVSAYADAGEKGGLVVEAVAGSGKTTTIVEAAKFIPQDEKAVFLAFNKSIATELAERLPSHIESKTLNALGFAVLRKHYGYSKPDQYKTRSITRKLIEREELPEQAGAVLADIDNLVAKAKSHGMVPDGMPGVHGLYKSTVERWAELIDRYQIDSDASLEDLSAWAEKVLRTGLESDSVFDFDDQLYHVVAYNLPCWKYRWIIIDEAQDVSHVQRAMLRKFLRDDGVIIAVGDRRQAIYGFRGADSQSLQNIEREFSCEVLPLSVTYRCPKAVVELAQQYCPELSCPDTAPEGLVKTLGDGDLDPETLDGDAMVLCRNVAPMVSGAYSLIAQRIPVTVPGRDIGAGLVNLIKKVAGKRSQAIEDFERKLDEWTERESEKARQRGQDNLLASIEDKRDSIQAVIRATDPANTPDLIREVQDLFDTKRAQGVVTLSTVHRAKGLEAKRVYILEPSLMPSKYARQDWQMEQERNLMYVAYTRALEELYFITLDNLRVVRED